MASASIPGLDYGPVDEVAATPEVSGIELMSFKCEPYMVPAPHGFGKCRLITEFEKLSYIGEGAFGSVYKVRDKKYDITVALKKLKIEKDAGFPINFSREINCLKLVEHDNIANLLGVAVGRVFESTYLILEYCPYDLSKILDDEEIKKEINHTHIKSIMHQLFTGLQVLHENFVVHRNLTMTSILFSETGVLKITDFSSSRQFTRRKMTPNVVPRCYRAPELLFGAEVYSSAIDIWSAGCIFAELLLKRPLFKTESDLDAISTLVDLLGTPTESIWPGFSDLPHLQNYTLRDQPHNKLTLKFAEQPTTCIALLHKIFIYNPSKRFSAEKCLIHSYFNDKPLACSLDTFLALLKKVNEI
ncbi:cyclin-dependent kinase 10-like [Argiope bruennichi]|uniref:Cyclin-dependent kinase 10 like protein n=1 Tax=Argiope bruennichi TaxID=94029 RepID=A0A8T0EPV8_ARGBR|nr:cyclin-dependent kinase 10-like [Argiope bruennichi]KAF8774575.1 Cyclin-dependent kinase 10 like protein [Argiope bruennichi]